MRNQSESGLISRFPIRIPIDLCVLDFGVLLLFLFLSAGCSQSYKIPAAKTQTPASNTLIYTPPSFPLSSLQTQTPVSNMLIYTPTSFPLSSLQTQTIVVDNAIKVSGYVIYGGDTTPDGLVDVPRKYEYQIETDDGDIINVTYTAFPPSPPGNERNKIRLDFYAGEILIGDYLQARGNYDGQTKTLIVTEDGDYILTYPAKP